MENVLLGERVVYSELMSNPQAKSWVVLLVAVMSCSLGERGLMSDRVMLSEMLLNPQAKSWVGLFLIVESCLLQGSVVMSEVVQDPSSLCGTTLGLELRVETVRC